MPALSSISTVGDKLIVGQVDTSFLTATGSYPTTTGSHAADNITPLGFRLVASSYNGLAAGDGSLLYVNGTVHIEFSSEL